MFKKFVSISSVGKFSCCKAAGDVEFKKLTLLYAENGRGKTTLCDVLRSLTDPNFNSIIGRTTLGQTQKPTVEVLLKSGTATFRDGKWNQHRSGVLIYDSRFIHENVFAGEHVELEHKRNLYQVIVGEQGVRLSQQLIELDNESRTLNKTIADEQKLISMEVKDGSSLDQFLALTQIQEIDKEITSQEGTVKALESSALVRNQGGFVRIEALAALNNVATTLSKQLDNVSEDAEKKVREHFQKHLGNDGQAWLSEGSKFIASEICPFCAQGLKGNELISAYKGYFSDEYTKLKLAVETLGTSLDNLASEATLLKIRHNLTSNETAREFWGAYLTVDLSTLNYQSIESDLRDYCNSLKELIDEKSRNLLCKVELTKDYQTKHENYQSLLTDIEKYNSSVDKLNISIGAIKTKLAAGDLVAEKKRLASLQNNKKRFEPEISNRCSTYVQLLNKRTEISNKKDEIKKELDRYSTDIFGSYQKKINDFLEMFGAEFRISKTERSYAGGKASSTYALVINETEISLDEPGNQDRAYFGNTLSSGDKSTLALAFFLARVQNDSEISSKIVVFDDPFNSQDKFRRTCTQQIINKIANSAEQVIVLSHSTEFLRMIWQGAGTVPLKTLQLFRVGDSSAITEWDIEDETRGDYYNNHALLTMYVRDGSGDRKNVAQSIRLLLEGYLRFKLPGKFSTTEWLGDMIGKIRDCDAASELACAKGILNELTDVNDYSKKYHHTTNPGADSETIDDGELKTFSKRALNLVGGF